MTEVLTVLEKIEAHLARIADAASLRMKRAASTEKTAGRKRAISNDDKPTSAHLDLAKRLGVDIAVEWPKFKAHCQSHDTKYANFEAAFRKWLFIASTKRVA